MRHAATGIGGDLRRKLHRPFCSAPVPQMTLAELFLCPHYRIQNELHFRHRSICVAGVSIPSNHHEPAWPAHYGSLRAQRLDSSVPRQIDATPIAISTWTRYHPLATLTEID